MAHLHSKPPAPRSSQNSEAQSSCQEIAWPAQKAKYSPSREKDIKAIAKRLKVCVGRPLIAVTESLIPGSRVFIVPGGSEGPERLSLPFPFSSKRRKEGGVGAIRSAGKERRRSSPLFPRGFSSETDPANPGRVWCPPVEI